MTDSSVDLPQPDGPMNNVNSPRCSSIDTPRSASVFASPAPNVWHKLRAFSTAFCAATKSNGRTEAAWQAPLRAGAKGRLNQLIHLIIKHVLAVQQHVGTGEIEAA